MKGNYVLVPENLIVIDFDLKDENGEKSSRGMHLHYLKNRRESK